jgi:hypothetical protein
MSRAKRFNPPEEYLIPPYPLSKRKGSKRNKKEYYTLIFQNDFLKNNIFVEGIINIIPLIINTLIFYL